MRKFLNLGLLGMFFIFSAPAGADQIAENESKTVGMLRSQAVQSQFQGNPDDALEKYQRAIECAKRAFGENAPYLAEIYYDMGSLCLNNAKYAAAEGHLNQALKLNPNLSAAHLRLAELKLLQSRFVSQELQYSRSEEAATQARAVLSKHRDDVVAHEVLARAFETGDDSCRAYSEYASVDKLVEINRDVYEGKPLPVRFALPAVTISKPKVDEGARKAADEARKAEQEAKKKSELDKKNAEAARKKSEQDARKKAEQEAKKKSDRDKKNAEAARKKAEQESRKKAEQEAKKKAAQEKKKQAPPAKAPDSTVAGETAGTSASLSSHAVLLTPINKKKPAASETINTVPSEPKKPVAVPKPAAKETAAEDETPPAKKSTPPPVKKGRKLPRKQRQKPNQSYPNLENMRPGWCLRHRR